jgi:serine/threonine-protein kinase
MAIAPNGNVLVSNQGSSQVLERLPNGNLISVAGNGQTGFSGDGGPASAAELDNPEGLAVSPAGTIYVADTGNNRIRAIAPTGRISTFAQLQSPTALAVGPSDVLYVVDSAGVQTVAANGAAVATVIPATSMVDGSIVHEVSIDGASSAFFPSAIAVSTSGAIYIANSSPKFLFEDDGESLSLVGQASMFGGQTYVTGAGLAAGTDGDIYVADYGAFAIDQVNGTSLKPVFTFQLKSVVGLDGFRPSGVAIGSGGEIYTDTDGVNGGSDRPALVRIDPDGHVHLLDVGPISS